MSSREFSIIIMTHHDVKYEVLIDTEDLSILDGRIPKWNRGYGAIDIHGKQYLIHRLIMKAEKNQYVDHINSNIRDNRKCNLRIVTKQQNNQHKRVKKESSTGVRGVHPYGKKFKASVGHNKKQIYVGCFNTISEAEKAVIQKRKELGFLDADTNDINS